MRLTRVMKANPGLEDGIPLGFSENSPPAWPAAAERRKHGQTPGVAPRRDRKFVQTVD
jgi:hypothetical protein